MEPPPPHPRSRSPMTPIHPMNGYHPPPHPPPNGVPHPPPGPFHHGGLSHRGYSPARSAERYMEERPPSAKMPHISHSNQSSPMSLTNHHDDRDRHSAGSSSAAGGGGGGGANRASPGPAGSGPRRK